MRTTYTVPGMMLFTRDIFYLIISNASNVIIFKNKLLFDKEVVAKRPSDKRFMLYPLLWIEAKSSFEYDLTGGL